MEVQECSLIIRQGSPPSHRRLRNSPAIMLRGTRSRRTSLAPENPSGRTELRGFVRGENDDPPPTK